MYVARKANFSTTLALIHQEQWVVDTYNLRIAFVQTYRRTFTCTAWNLFAVEKLSVISR